MRTDELSTLSDIRRVAKRVTNSELNRLRMEEELLVSLVQKSGESLALKKAAFARMDIINKMQRELLGSTCK